jgi:hypothetical protein
MQGLQQQCPKATDKHGRIGVYDSNWSIVGKPSWAINVHNLLHACIGVWTNHSITQCFTKRIAQIAQTRLKIERLCDVHALMVPRQGSIYAVTPTTTVKM